MRCHMNRMHESYGRTHIIVTSHIAKKCDKIFHEKRPCICFWDKAIIKNLYKIFESLNAVKWIFLSFKLAAV